jgi:hypothetical protein
MARRSEFTVVPPSRKTDLLQCASLAQSPKLVIHHISLGRGVVSSVRLSEGGSWVVAARFGNQWKTLRLEQAYFAENVNDIIALAPYFPAPKPPIGKKPKAKHTVEQEQPETTEPTERALRGDRGSEESGEELSDARHNTEDEQAENDELSASKRDGVRGDRGSGDSDSDGRNRNEGTNEDNEGVDA